MLQDSSCSDPHHYSDKVVIAKGGCAIPHGVTLLEGSCTEEGREGKMSVVIII